MYRSKPALWLSASLSVIFEVSFAVSNSFIQEIMPDSRGPSVLAARTSKTGRKMSSGDEGSKVDPFIIPRAWSEIN